MKVYLVRHGQSELNKKAQHQYPEDPLSELGKKQARLVGERFKRIPIEVILSSDYPRAKDTAQEIHKTTGKEIILEPLLREKLQPSIFWGRQIDDPELLEIKKLMQDNSHDPSWHHSDEENYHDMEKRVKDFLGKLIKRTEKNIAVVSHGAFIKTIITYLFFGDESSADYFLRVYNFFWASNTGITVLEYRDPEINPSGSDDLKRWHLMTWNDHSHVADLL